MNYTLIKLQELVTANEGKSFNISLTNNVVVSGSVTVLDDTFLKLENDYDISVININTIVAVSIVK